MILVDSGFLLAFAQPSFIGRKAGPLLAFGS